jgi:hypothetical protein
MAAAAKSSDFDIRTECQYYAKKYKCKSDQLEKGLEAYAVHLFAQEESFDSVLEGAPTTEANLLRVLPGGDCLVKLRPSISYALNVLVTIRACTSRKRDYH